MAYPDPLDPATPSGAQDLGLGDDRIREAKRAIMQRLLTIFTNLDLDPLVFIDGIIPTAALVAQAVTTAKLLDGGVTTPKIADAAVTTPKIADGAVSLPKIPDELLTKTKILGTSTSTKLVAENSGTYVAGGGGLAVAGNSIIDQVVAVTNALGGDQVAVTYTGLPDAGLSWCGFVSGSGFVTVRIRNHTGVLITIPAGNGFVVTAFKNVG